MIENDQQLAITKEWRDKFQNSLQDAINSEETGDGFARQVSINALKSQVEELDEQIREYEERKLLK